jgi:hypothetical protein
LESVVIDGRLPIGVSLALAVDEVLMKLLPPAGLHVVTVHDEVAAAGRAVAVDEQQSAVREIVELGVGDAGFAPAGHGGLLPQFQ